MNHWTGRTDRDLQMRTARVLRYNQFSLRKKNQLRIRVFRKISHHFWRIYGIYLESVKKKKTERSQHDETGWTWKQTLGSWPIIYAHKCLPTYETYDEIEMPLKGKLSIPTLNMEKGHSKRLYCGKSSFVIDGSSSLLWDEMWTMVRDRNVCSG